MFERAIAEVTHDPYGWITIALLIGSLVLAFPWRHRRVIVTKRIIRAAPEAVWESLRKPPAHITSQTPDPFDPNIIIVTYARPGLELGNRAITARLRILLSDPPRRQVTRFEEVAGKPFPFGKGSSATEALEQVPGGTLAVIIFDGEFNSSLNALRMRWVIRRALARVAKERARAGVAANASTN